MIPYILLLIVVKQMIMKKILIECWKKEYEMKRGKYFPLLHCITVDCFAAPCFVAEDTSGLVQLVGTVPVWMVLGI